MKDRLEQLMAAHRYQEVLQKVGATLADPLAPAEAAALAWLYGARAHGRLERYVTAVSWAERGLAMQPADPWTEGMLHLILGTALLYTGDVARAERALCRFFELAVANQELGAFRPLALCNMAFAHRTQKRWDQEIAFLCEAANAYQERGDGAGARLCRLELARHHLSQGNAEGAWPHLERVLATADPLGPDGEESLQAALIWYKFSAGRVAEAEAEAIEMLQEEGVHPHTLADLAWLLGRHALAREEIVRAERWSKMATRHAATAWVPAQMDRAAQLQREVEQRRGR